jgi:hypothetical protein
MIENALVSLIRGVAGNARVTPSTETVLVYTELPRIIYTLATTEENWTDDGDDDLLQARYTLDIFANTMTEARNLGTLLRKRVADGGLNGYKGTVDSTKIDLVMFRGPNFAQGEPIPGGKTIARVSEDISVWYRE